MVLIVVCVACANGSLIYRMFLFMHLLLRLPVGRGGVINSPRFCFFPVSKVDAPLMDDTAVRSLSHDF